MASNNRIIFDMGRRTKQQLEWNDLFSLFWMKPQHECKSNSQNCIRTHNPSNCEWNAKLHACIFTKPIEPSRKLVGYNEPLTFLGLPVEFSFDIPVGTFFMRKPQGLVPSSWITSINDDEEYE